MPTAYHPPLKRGSIPKIFNRPKDNHVTSNTECGIVRPSNAIYMGSYSLLGAVKMSSTVMTLIQRIF